MVNLQNTPSAGPLTVADLNAARQHNAGNIWLMPRRVPGRDTCNGSCQSSFGCECWRDTVPTDWRGLDACAPEGGKFRNPSPALESMLRHRRNRLTVGRVMLLALAAYASHLVWPMLKLAA